MAAGCAPRRPGIALRAVRRLLLPAAALLLAVACTGDTQVAGAGGAGTGGFASIGRVDGFGSTIVEGERLDDADARLRRDRDPEAPDPVALGEVTLGSSIQATAQDGALLGATVAPELIAQATEDLRYTDRFVLAGQTVLLAAHPAIRPVLEAVDGDFITAGTVLEVHGDRRADGALVATRVQQRPGTETATRLVGPVAQFDAATARFRIGGAVVDARRARLLPAGARLADGARVSVFADRADAGGGRTADGAILARTVRVEPASSPEGTALRVTGFAQQVAGRRFVLRGQPVDAGAAVFEGDTTAADLATDALLRVQGEVRGGVLQASRVRVLRAAGPADIALRGPLTDFSGADRQFRLRGAGVTIDPATVLQGGTLDNLADGVDLHVSGRVVAGGVVAATVAWPDDGPVMAGTVSGLDAVAGTLRLPPSGRTVRLAPATRFVGGTAADLRDGRRIRVRGTPGAGTLVAASVTFLGPSAAPLDALLVGTLTLAAPGTVFVNDTLVGVDGATAITGGEVDDGVFAVVRATRKDGVLVATAVDIRPELPGRVRMAGFVGEGLADGLLRVGGQKVDPAGAALQGFGPGGPEAAQYVLVTGRMGDDGVLRAESVAWLAD